MAEIPKESVNALELYPLGECVSDQVRNHGWFERNTLELLAFRHPRAHTATIIDVGANIGNHCHFWLTQTECTHIVAFEPDPENYRRLQRLNCDRLTTHQLAVTDAPATFEMHNENGPFNSGTGKVKPGNAIKGVPLDSIGITGRVGLVKMDIEGHEPQALAGAVKLLETHRPLLWLEADNQLQTLTEMLKPMGYRQVMLMHDGNLQAIFAHYES